MLLELAGAATAAAGLTGLAGWAAARRKGVDRWLAEYARTAGRRGDPAGPVDVLLAVCDHYEPKRGGASAETASRRVRQWVDEYPRRFAGFRDSDGRPPRHSFFYPEEEYEPGYLDDLAGLCRAGFGEVEVHLHHDADTAENLRRTLVGFKETLAGRHGLLSRDAETGEVVYGFIHGNWALDNCRRDGRYCGVNSELDVLRETGCYADFTLPSAPSETQTRTVNRIYWAVDDPDRPKSHDRGVPLGDGPRPDRGLLMVQGPLALDWSARKFGLLPRIENACLQRSQPPSARRLRAWVRAGVRVDRRPDWVFVKLHTHGVNEPNQDVLLGEPMVRFHAELAARASAEPAFRYHYVTAREMANLALAAADGWTGSVAQALNYRYRWLGETRAAAGSGRSAAAGPT
jgi:hypothetical protein